MTTMQKEIIERWQWDGIRATPAAIRLAVKATGNKYGITVGGHPWLKPKVGDRVELYSGPVGMIVKLTKVFRRCADLEATIKTDDGQQVHLFQNALRGYRVLRKEVQG